MIKMVFKINIIFLDLKKNCIIIINNLFLIKDTDHNSLLKYRVKKKHKLLDGSVENIFINKIH